MITKATVIQKKNGYWTYEFTTSGVTISNCNNFYSQKQVEQHLIELFKDMGIIDYTMEIKRCK